MILKPFTDRGIALMMVTLKLVVRGAGAPKIKDGENQNISNLPLLVSKQKLGSRFWQAQRQRLLASPGDDT